MLSAIWVLWGLIRCGIRIALNRRVVKKISREELKAKIDREEPFILIETLPPYQFENGHLPGAINIPANQISELSASMLPDKSAEIVVYCANLKCQSSGHAARELEQLGYTRVLVYAEGKADWLGAGFELEQATTPEGSLTINHD